MTPFTDADRAAVKTIQEMTGCMPEQARGMYRTAAKTLADPDVEGRDKIILENLERAGWVRPEPPAPKKTRNERRIETNKRRDAKKAEKKAKAPKKANGEKKTRERKAKEEPAPLVELGRELELMPVDDSNFHQVKFKGAYATAYFLERDRKAGQRFGNVHIADTKFNELKKAAKKNEQDAVVCIALRVNNKLEQGYVVPVSAFTYLGDENPYWRLEFSNEARKSHGDVGYDDCKFNIAKAVEKAA